MVTKVTSGVLADDAVANANVADEAVDTAELADVSVTAAKLAADAVTTAKIANLAVTAAKIADATITGAKLVDATITAAKYGAGSVDTTALGTGSVTTAKLAAGAVDTAALAATAVTLAKMANSSVGTAQLVDASVTTAKLAFTALSVGKMTIWVPATAMTPSATAGCTQSQVNFGSGTKPTIPVMAFSDGSSTYGDYNIRMPKSWDGSTTNVYAYWMHNSGASSFVCRWSSEWLHIGASESANATTGATATVDSTGGSSGTLYISSAMALTGGSPAVADITFLKIARLGGHGNDTLNVDAYLVGVMVEYTIDKANDS